MTREKVILLLALCVPIVCAAQVTPHQAQTLPLRELASRVLGDAGSLMIDVQRPAWGPRPLLLPTSIPWPPAGSPPLDELTFYGAAFATGSQFGICGSDWVTVAFNKNGTVARMRAIPHYGVAGDIYAQPGKWTYAQYGKMCGSVTSTRDYFQAPDGQAALEVASYIDALQRRGPFKKQDFTYSCSGLCGVGREALGWLNVKNIDWVKDIECPTLDLKIPSCYAIKASTYGVYKVYGTYYMNRVIIKAVHVERYPPLP